MKNKIIEQIEQDKLKQDVPEFGPGDTLVVQVRVVEGSRERLQALKLSSVAVIEASIRLSPCERCRM